MQKFWLIFLRPLVIAPLMLASCGSPDVDARGPAADLSGIPPIERFDAIVALRDPVDRTYQLALLLYDLEPSDAEAVDSRFKASVGRLDESAGILFGSWWAGFDPVAALQSGARWPWEGGRLGVRVVLRRWAASDPMAAFSILGEMPLREEAELQNATRALAQGFFDADPPPGPAELDLVLEILSPIPDPKSRHVAFDALLAGMADRWGIDETERFVDEMPQGPHAGIFRDFSRRFISVLAATDPVRAVAWVERVAPGSEGKFLRRRLAARWARTGGASAMSWVLQRPPGEDRDDLVEHAYRRFVQADNLAAVNWMLENAEANADALDPALPLFIGRMVREQPARAAEWVERVQDPEGRRIAALNVARGWLKRDEQAAKAWLPDSGLSLRDRNNVIREVQSQQ